MPLLRLPPGQPTPRRHRRGWAVLLLALAGLVGCGHPSAEAVPTLGAEAFWAQYDPAQDVLLDVRTGFEYGRGHLDGALHANVFSLGFRSSLDTLDRATPVYLYCQSGARSGRAGQVLQEMGFERVYNVGAYGTLQVTRP